MQEEDDEDSASLADVLAVLVAAYPKEFLAKDVAAFLNTSRIFGVDEESSDKKLVRDYLLPGAPADHSFSAKSVGRLLRRHLDNPVKTDDGRMLVLRKRKGGKERSGFLSHRKSESTRRRVKGGRAARRHAACGQGCRVVPGVGGGLGSACR
jgi:hypothetical protein